MNDAPCFGGVREPACESRARFSHFVQNRIQGSSQSIGRIPLATKKSL